MKNEQIVGVVYAIFFLPAFVVLWFLFYKRARFYPIYGRNPKLVHCFNAIYFCLVSLGTFTVILELNLQWPCVIFMWCKTFGFLLIIFILVLRAWLLMFKFEIEHEKQKLERHFFGRWKWLASKTFVVVIMISLAIYTIIGSIVTIWLYEQATVTPTMCNESTLLVSFPLFWTLIPNMILIGVLLFTYCKIRRYQQDGYGLKSEFQCVGATLIVGVLVQIFLLAAKINSSVASFWVVLSINPFLFASMTGWPLIQSYRVKKRLFGASSDSSGTTARVILVSSTNHTISNLQFTIENFLADQHQFELFSTFCAKHFVSENPSFYKQVKDLHQTNHDQVLNLARRIYFTFIQANSTMEINISAQMRKSIGESFAKMEYMSLENIRRMYDTALDEVLLLMQTNLWDIFTSSAEYKKLIAI
jgi:hypothetical protein